MAEVHKRESETLKVISFVALGNWSENDGHSMREVGEGEEAGWEHYCIYIYIVYNISLVFPTSYHFTDISVIKLFPDG